MANFKEGWLYICFLLLCQFSIFYMFPIWFMYFKNQCFTYMKLNRCLEVLILYSCVVFSFALTFGHIITLHQTDRVLKVTSDSFAGKLCSALVELVWIDVILLF